MCGHRCLKNVWRSVWGWEWVIWVVLVSEEGQIWVSKSKWESDRIGCVRRSLGLKAWEWQAWEWRVSKGLFVFFFHHLSLLTQFLSLITHHLKYPNFLYPTCLAFSASHHSIFSTFCGTHACKLVRTLLLSLPSKPIPHHFLHCSFHFATTMVTMPKCNQSSTNNKNSQQFNTT